MKHKLSQTSLLLVAGLALPALAGYGISQLWPDSPRMASADAPRLPHGELGVATDGPAESLSVGLNESGQRGWKVGQGQPVQASAQTGQAGAQVDVAASEASQSRVARSVGQSPQAEVGDFPWVTGGDAPMAEDLGSLPTIASGTGAGQLVVLPSSGGGGGGGGGAAGLGGGASGGGGGGGMVESETGAGEGAEIQEVEGLQDEMTSQAADGTDSLAAGSNEGSVAGEAANYQDEAFGGANNSGDLDGWIEDEDEADVGSGDRIREQGDANDDLRDLKKVRLYAWTKTSEAGISNALLLDRSESVATVLLRARDRWRGLDPADRCIMIAPLSELQSDPFRKDLTELVVNGPNLEDSKQWWQSVLNALEKNDLLPARVALDWEAGFGYWNMKGEGDGDLSDRFEVLWEDSQARGQLPPEFDAFEPDDFNYRKNKNAVIAWESYAKRVRLEALAEAFVAPLVEIVPDAHITNYGDRHMAYELKDPRGWPYPSGGIYKDSSPVLYHKNVEANLEQLRSVIEDSKKTVPWVPYPSYVGYEVWEETVRGAHALGVREFLYWNPGLESKVVGDDVFAASVIRDLNLRSAIQDFAIFD